MSDYLGRLGEFSDLILFAMRSRGIAARVGGTAMNGTNFIDVNSAVIRFRIAGQGFPTLVFCVDPPVVIELYDELIAELAKEFRVVVFEPPGFGLSFPRLSFSFSQTGLNSAVETFLDRLALGRYVLIFPCVTAYGALWIAHRRPDLVSHLVLPQAPSWSQELVWRNRRDPRGLLRCPVVGQLALRLLRRRRAPDWFRYALADGSQLAKFNAATDDAFARGAGFSLASAFQRYLTPNASAPDRVDTPTLVVWGECDRSHAKTDKSSSKELATAVSCQHFLSAGHFPELESPKEFAHALRGFLAANPERMTGRT
jgi:pimeloyl-ACP methyl ester carboxylesterase